MKLFPFCILIAFSLLSCNSSQNENPPADKPLPSDTISVVDQTSVARKKSDENIALVNKFVTAIESQDTLAMSSVMADTYKGYGPSIGDSAGKTEYLKNWNYNFKKFFSSIKFNRSHNMEATTSENSDAEPGEWISNWSYCTVQYRDGKGPIYIWINSVFKIENGKIVKCRVFYNEADWLRQLGYQLVHSSSSTHI